jgi:putative ABC transport system permease protein
MPRFALALALRIVDIVSLIVPAAERADWKREWRAELQHLAMQRQPQPRRLIGRALGSLPDAAWIRRQFTLDADAVRDALLGMRMLRKTPGFTAIALVIFALGIGATTAIVSVADVLFLRGMTIPQPERVMTVWQFNRDTGIGRLDVTPGTALDWIARARVFEAAATAESWTLNNSESHREPEYITAAKVGDRFFDVLGVPMRYGRPFSPQEFQPNGPRVAMLSERYWRDRLGGDPAIVGKAVPLDDGAPFTIVGVMQAGVELRLFASRGRRPEPQVWLPKQGVEPFERDGRAGVGYWNVVGRLRPGVSVSQAQAEFDAVSAQLAREYPQTNRQIGAQVVPLRSHLVGSLRDVLPLLFGAAVVLLIVACTNVANLLLARGAARARELAVRHALGASRGRLVRQLLVESLLLAIAGGILGLVVARGMLDAIAWLRPGDIALLDPIPLDARAAIIACAITLIAAIVAGLTPALQLSRPATAHALKEGRTVARRSVSRLLVVLEVAAALVLAIGAGLLARSFMLIQQVDPGFSREHVSAVQVFVSNRLDTPQKRILLFQQAIDRIRALPGVVAAGGVTALPFGEAKVLVRGAIAIPGHATAAGDDAQIVMAAVAGDYFRAMGVPLLEGRLFDATDTPQSRQVVLVSRSAAQQFWPHADPVGSRVRFRFVGTTYDAEVIGIVGDVRHDALDRPADAELFLPYTQSGFRALSIVARTAPDSPVTLQMLKEQIWSIDPQQAIYNAASVEDQIAKTLVGRRFSLALLGGFALATLLLASAGVYGVMSFFTAQRMREFAVRLALGAGRRDILRLVLGEGVRLAAIGVIVGVLLALPLARLLETLLFGVTASDPVTFVCVSVGLVLVAAPACYLPARRALAVDPAEALRLD